MNLVKKQIYIGGMTCVNCQNKIERKLRKTAGISKAAVSYQKECAWITYDADQISLEEITAIIGRLDYQVLAKREKKQADIGRVAGILIVILILYAILERTGILNLLVPGQLAETGMGYGMLFVVGVLTSVHCVAMCGGINLTQCLSGMNAVGTDKKISTFLPSLLYNLGRVISYTAIGFVLGFAGRLIGGSGAGVPVLLQGILKMIAGIFMVIMGINMLNIFPWLRRLWLRMPRFLAVKTGAEREKHTQPFAVGLLNGLMPCGPLQSMQIVALACANPFAGALSMFLFSLGTVPLMLGLGSFISALGRRFTQKVMGIGAILVVVLGLAMLAQGGSLSGLFSPKRLLFAVIVLSVFGVISSAFTDANAAVRRWAVSLPVLLVVVLAGVMARNHITASVVEIDENEEYAEYEESGDAPADGEITDGVQVINSMLEPGSYPNITVVAGVPVKWVIDAPEGSINGCNYVMLLSEYGIEHVFQAGENIIEFTPTESGTVIYTCWMGMIRGSIHVIDGEG